MDRSLCLLAPNPNLTPARPFPPCCPTHSRNVLSVAGAQCRAPVASQRPRWACASGRSSPSKPHASAIIARNSFHLPSRGFSREQRALRFEPTAEKWGIRWGLKICRDSERLRLLRGSKTKGYARYAAGQSDHQFIEYRSHILRDGRGTAMTLMTRWLLLLGFAPLCVANERLHKYNVGERVNLWVNRVGPYHNPQEVSATCASNLCTSHVISMSISPSKTYNYYKLPFCHPDLGLEAKKKSLTIGETLEGHDLTNSGYEIHFARALSPRASRELCPSHARNITAQRTCKPPRAAP